MDALKVSPQKPLSGASVGIMCFTWLWCSSRCWEDRPGAAAHRPLWSGGQGLVFPFSGSFPPVPSLSSCFLVFVSLPSQFFSFLLLLSLPPFLCLFLFFLQRLFCFIRRPFNLTFCFLVFSFPPFFSDFPSSDVFFFLLFSLCISLPPPHFVFSPNELSKSLVVLHLLELNNTTGCRALSAS